MAPSKKRKKQNYAQYTNLYTMDGTDIAEDHILAAVQIAVLEQYNSAARVLQNEQAVFVKFDKVEYVYACGGRFYFLCIRVKGILSEEESIIEKIVWKGTSMEVLETNTNKKVDSSSTKKKFPKGKFADFTNLMLSVCSTDTCHLRLVRIHDFELKEWSTDILMEGGWFNFEVCTLTVEAKPMEGVGIKVVIEASLICREWLQIMDDQKASSFRAWKDDMLKAHAPPYGCDSGSEGFLFYPINLCSPQVLTQAWLAVKDHNYKEGTDLEFVKVVKAEYVPSTGTYYYLTFEAEEHGIVATFQVVVYEIASTNCWKPVTLLKPCKMEDEYEVPEPWSESYPNLLRFHENRGRHA